MSSWAHALNTSCLPYNVAPPFWKVLEAVGDVALGGGSISLDVTLKVVPDSCFSLNYSLRYFSYSCKSS